MGFVAGSAKKTPRIVERIGTLNVTGVEPCAWFMALVVPVTGAVHVVMSGLDVVVVTMRDQLWRMVVEVCRIMERATVPAVSSTIDSSTAP